MFALKRIFSSLLGRSAISAVCFVTSLQAAGESINYGTGEMYVFARPQGAYHLGHVGWGYKTDSFPDQYCAGGVENPGGSAYVVAGGDIGYWQICQLSYAAMIQEMKARGYVQAKGTTVGPVYTFGAADFANNTVRTRGYSVVGKNCANATWDVAAQYGVPTTALPLLQVYPAPNSWYGALTYDKGWGTLQL
ncbi:MAG: hypothetical protein M3Q07_08565 [Pseudobdellovibrionaceae bacterium]|nr:hypothetical protein [Pseudobdellovibrionaceae bacterium]